MRTDVKNLLLGLIIGVSVALGLGAVSKPAEVGPYQLCIAANEKYVFDARMNTGTGQVETWRYFVSRVPSQSDEGILLKPGIQNPLDVVKDDRLKPHNYHKIHILDIVDGFEKVKRGFHKDCIGRSVKKAVRCGVTVKQACSEQDLKDFYSVHARARKQQGFPIHPYRFFKNMWEILYPLGYFMLLLAEQNEKPIAGVVLFKFKDTVSFEHGASIAKYLAVRPNHLALWRAIEMACLQGYRYFDFGKTPIDNKGLLDFKRRWSADMYDVPYFYYPEIKGAMSLEQSDLKYRLFRSAQRYMPLSLAKTMGEIAYRHLG